LNLGQHSRLPTRQEWEAAQPAPDDDSTVRLLAPEHRTAILEQALAHEVKPRFRLLHRGEFEATYEIAPNHVLHGVLSLLTLGLWLIVWFFIALVSNQRAGVRVDEYGRIQHLFPNGWGSPTMPPASVSLPPGVSIPPPPSSPEAFAAIRARRAEEKAAKQAKRAAKRSS